MFERGKASIEYLIRSDPKKVAPFFIIMFSGLACETLRAAIEKHGQPANEKVMSTFIEKMPMISFSSQLIRRWLRYLSGLDT